MPVNLQIKYIAKQHNGELVIADKETFRQQLKRFGDNEICVTIKPWKATRSNNQNRYYFGVLVALTMENHGFNTPDEAHEYLKMEYNHEIVFIRIKGAIAERKIPQSSIMNSAEFEAYCSRIRTGESQKGFWLPEPNETEYD